LDSVWVKKKPARAVKKTTTMNPITTGASTVTPVMDKSLKTLSGMDIKLLATGSKGRSTDILDNWLFSDSMDIGDLVIILGR
jgi:hypothetical protein